MIWHIDRFLVRWNNGNIFIHKYVFSLMGVETYTIRVIRAKAFWWRAVFGRLSGTLKYLGLPACSLCQPTNVAISVSSFAIFKIPKFSDMVGLVSLFSRLLVMRRLFLQNLIT